MVPVFEDLLKIIKHFLNILHKMCYSIKFYLLIYYLITRHQKLKKVINIGAKNTYFSVKALFK